MQTHPLLSSACLCPIQTLPISQARGVILGYEVGLVYNTGEMAQMNVPTPGSSDQLSQLMQYCRTFLKGVSSVSVSALNALGATVPSHLAMPAPGISCLYCHKNKGSFVSGVVFT